jgi:iodotyrosine deiodinase
MKAIKYVWTRFEESDQMERGAELLAELDGRRSIRHFSDRPVGRDLIETAIRIASTAPSGAHRQPWKFVAVRDPQIQREIRLAAEKEEHAFYQEGRATEEWLHALEPLGTSWEKPFLEVVPWLVVVFEEVSQETDEGSRLRNYYTKESVGIACGMFIAALHRMGLATLTHTPSPMGFLRDILGRPSNERPFILFPVGYPADECLVPDIRRKALSEVAVFRDSSTPSPGE